MSRHAQSEMRRAVSAERYLRARRADLLLIREDGSMRRAMRRVQHAHECRRAWRKEEVRGGVICTLAETHAMPPSDAARGVYAL